MLPTPFLLSMWVIHKNIFYNKFEIGIILHVMQKIFRYTVRVYMYTTSSHPRASVVRPIKKYEYNHGNCLSDIQNVYKFKTNGIRDAIQ